MMDFIVKKITNYIVDKKIKPQMTSNRISLSQDIEVLKKLREELIQKDLELNISKVEWDRTFDAIIDDIIIINKEGVVTKANKSFIYYVKSLNGRWKEVIGRSWSDIREEIGITTPCIVNKCLEDGTYQEAVITLHNRTYSVLANPVFDSEGAIQSVIRVSRDITKIEQQKQRLDRRGRIFESISNMTQLLMDHKNWDNALSEILKILGEAVGASRVYIFTNEVKEDRVCANLSEMWVDKDMNGCMMTECVNYSLLPSWKEDLEVGNTVEGKIKECMKCKDKESCIHLNNIEVCAVPIFSDKKWWGFIGFDYDSKIKQWKEEDEAILRIAADIIGGVIHHRDRYYKCLNNNGKCND